MTEKNDYDTTSNPEYRGEAGEEVKRRSFTTKGTKDTKGERKLK